MNKMPVSIFNDVIGPVMRGASSSHVAGASRIAALVRQSFEKKISKAIVDFDTNDSLAFSHTEHGSDMGFACGLMGMELTDPMAVQYNRLLEENNIQVQYRVMNYDAEYPGNYRIRLTDENGNTNCWEAVSTGGGMIRLWKFGEFDIDIKGDFYEVLIVCDTSVKEEEAWEKFIRNQTLASEYTLISESADGCLINRKYSQPVNISYFRRLERIDGIMNVICMEPVLPVLSKLGCAAPYSSASELIKYCKNHSMKPWEYGAYYESRRSDLDISNVYSRMENILSVMEESIDQELKGTEYSDRILNAQSYRVKQAETDKKLIPCGPINSMIQCVTATMESKSAMGLIVAAPTCGSCGCLPGTVIGVGRELGASRDDMVKGLFVAGLIGVFFAEQATFSAEIGGCQVECGAASGMAAAALVQMMGGNIEQCLDAASIALQNITGLACDPVGGTVEVPCLGKNIMAGSNAVSSANMALAGFDKVIPLDETIQAIYEIGKALPLELRCTFGGLGKTRASLEIMKKLRK